MIWLIKFFLSFSSITYVLLLAQSLAAFRQNSVFCYCLAFGLFLFSMSLGETFIERDIKRSFRTLWLAQMALVLMGSLGVVSFFFVDHLYPWNAALWVWAWLIIVTIGCLAGSAWPLLVKIAEEKKGPSRNVIMGVDYAGYFLGSLAFVFIFYPYAGIIQAVFFVASLNALCGVAILGLMKHEGLSLRLAWVAQVVIFLLIMGALVFWPLVEGILITLYTR